jgi:flagellar hook-basal body complex protein FliE
MKLGELLNGNISSTTLNGLFDNKIKPNNQIDFANTLKDSIDNLDKIEDTSYQAMQDIATGKVENLQEAVVKIEKAEINLRLALEVKNKTISAYKEVMRMQI